MSSVFYHMFTFFFFFGFSFCSVFASVFHSDLLYGYLTVTIFNYAGDMFVTDFHIVLKFVS